MFVDGVNGGEPVRLYARMDRWRERIALRTDGGGVPGSLGSRAIRPAELENTGRQLESSLTRQAAA